MDCFTDKKEQNRLLYGQEEPCKNFIVDWKGNILPNLLKIILNSCCYSDSFLCYRFKNQETGKIELSNLWERVYILQQFIKIPTHKDVFDWKEVPPYENRSDLLGLFTQCKSVITKDYSLKSFDIAYFLYCIGTKIHLDKNLPKELTEGFIKFFNDTFLMFSEHFPEELVQNILKQYKFIPSIDALDVTPPIQGYTLQQRTDYTVEIAFINKQFKTEYVDDLKHILEDKTRIVQGIIFEGCEFPELKTKCISPSILFRNCYFEKGLEVRGIVRQTLRFSSCRVKGYLDFDKVNFNKSLYISFSCLSLSMNDSKFNKNATFKIADTSIFEKASFNSADLSCKTDFSYIVFHDAFNFSNTILGVDCSFNHIAFSGLEIPNIKKSKQTLVETLQKYNYNQVIVSLGLTQVPNTSFTDYDAYKVAYETGYLKSEYAAYLLEKSVSYLGQKRKKDKERTTRDSIPFIGEGKNIKYPVEALLAYKAKDWDKLKELRQKYKNKED